MWYVVVCCGLVWCGVVVWCAEWYVVVWYGVVCCVVVWYVVLVLAIGVD